MKKIILAKLMYVMIAIFMSLSFQLSAQTNISGTITDNENIPIIGVNILLENTSTGTVTDIDGKYTISVPSEGGVLKFSYIGYNTQTKVIESGSNNLVFDLTMSEDALAMDEVVVTGTFTGRTQKNSPMSLTVLNANQLQRLASSSQADVLRTVPGITAEGGGGEVATNLFVRGFPSGGQYAFTPLQIDGIPILTTFGLNSSAHDVFFRNDIGIRSLEFVRGGSSTLFGAGSVAGIVNYNSVRGSATPENKIQLEWAEGGRIKTDFLSAGPLSDNLFYAVSGFYRYDEGPLETGLPTEGYQIRGNIKKVFNEGNSSIVVSAQKIDDNVQFYLPYPLDNSSGNRERPIGNDGEEIFTMLSGQLKDFAFDTPNGRFKSPIGNGVTTDGGFLMMDLKHSFGNDWRLSAKTKAASYDHFFNLFLDGDGTHNTPEDQANYLLDRNLPSNAQFVFLDNGVELASNDLLFENRILDRERNMDELVAEINLTKTIDNHNITVGTFLSHTTALDNNWIHNVLGDFSNSPRAVGVSYFDTDNNLVNYSTGGFIAGRQTSNNTIESSKVAFYAADEIKGDKFDLDIGVRWERAAGIISKETGVGSNTFNKGSVSASDIAVAIAGLYKLSSSTNVYANFSRGYFFPQLRSVSFPLPGVPQSYETETVIQGEVGLKYAKNKLAGTAAIFINALSDRRNVDFINDPSNPGNIIEEVSLQSTSTFGFEGSVNYTIMDGLNFTGNLTYQSHKFTKVESNPEQEGNKIARIPNIMGMVGLSYEKNNIDASVTSNFLGSKFANNSNTVELDGFNIVRLNAGYTFDLGKSNESVRLGLSVFNLLDAAGVTEGSPRQGNSQVAGGNFFVGRPILPRRIFIRAAFNF
jgi:outer membrane receptor protein involved in Fe transport